MDTRATQRAAGARQRAKSEAAYRGEFEQAVLDWLGFAPEHDVVDRNIAAHAAELAVKVGSGRVRRTRTLTLDERAALAARAYIRHQYTDYEKQLVRRDMAELGVDDELDIVDYGEITRDAPRPVDELLERNRPSRPRRASGLQKDVARCAPC